MKETKARERSREREIKEGIRIQSISKLLLIKRGGKQLFSVWMAPMEKQNLQRKLLPWQQNTIKICSSMKLDLISILLGVFSLKEIVSREENVGLEEEFTEAEI
jgi:hypothetical protein